MVYDKTKMSIHKCNVLVQHNNTEGMTMREEEQLLRANRLGAKEDIIHVSETDDGHDLRDATYIGEKQMAAPNYRQ
ncbi:hypothetical protein JS44_10225 [Anoxybacillus flavithermus]|uniref:Uncharacterized protein n=2 Tax=Anoxybacillus TaxID=150247 RepID=A0A094JIJ7_9BACL|nr:hypothetical protein JS44_10225 [Anoxybacillus flavithermus]